MQDYQQISVEHRGAVALLTLQRPERLNAWTYRMSEELMRAIESANADPGTGAIVLTGAGRGFCAGADVRDAFQQREDSVSGPGAGSAREGSWVHLVRRSKPLVAAVNGVAAGAGCNLALGCDLIIASDQARFTEIFAKRGLVLDFGGSWLLPRLVGLHKAKELAFLAEILNAHDAESIGIVNRVVPRERFEAESNALAARLAAGPPLQLAVIKRQLNDSFSHTMAEAIELEGLAQSLVSNSQDTTEAMLAFVQKRNPRFTGD